MTKPVTVEMQLSAEQYERAQRIARFADVSVAIILLESIELLPFGGIALETLETYTDLQLWAVVFHHLSRREEEAYQSLHEKRASHTLTAEEEHRLDEILKTIDSNMLFRSKALAILQERGYDVVGYLDL